MLRVTVINNGDETSYDLEIKYVGNETQTFAHKDIHLDGNETHCITPISWENLSESKVRIDIDKDNDGIWDKHEFLTQKKEKIPSYEIPLLVVAIALAFIWAKRAKGKH